MKQNARTEAWERSNVSNMRLMAEDIWMTSPLMRHNFLLSSRTVFMFSIHTASMGPSNTTHFRPGISLEANSRKVFAVTPSDHWKIKSYVQNSELPLQPIFPPNSICTSILFWNTSNIAYFAKALSDALKLKKILYKIKICSKKLLLLILLIYILIKWHHRKVEPHQGCRRHVSPQEGSLISSTP